jgi:hypothetical protein
MVSLLDAKNEIPFPHRNQNTGWAARLTVQFRLQTLGPLMDAVNRGDL